MTKEDKSWIEEKFSAILNSFKKQIVNIVLQDANGVAIDFTEVLEGETPELGSVATIDGQPAEGEYIMPDGSTFIFVAGELTEIVLVDTNEELDALRKQLAEKEAELQANATKIAEQEETITNIVKEVKELKAGITSRFDGDKKKDKKSGDDDPIVNHAAAALENLKNKRRK